MQLAQTLKSTVFDGVENVLNSHKYETADKIYLAI